MYRYYQIQFYNKLLHTGGYAGNGLRNTRPAAFVRASVVIADRVASGTLIAVNLFPNLNLDNRRFLKNLL